MAKAQMKMQPTGKAVTSFIENVENETWRTDAWRLLEIMQEASGEKPRMWGPSIIGFGVYHYVYESGREGDMCRVGFSPRKAHLVIYIMPGYQDFSALLTKLGKHKMGKSCLYINKLADVDEKILVQMLMKGLKTMDRKYPR